MNTFKKLATLSMALLFALGLGTLTACNGDDSSTNSTAPNSTNSESSVTNSTDSTEDSSVETADSSSEEQKTYTHYEFTVLDKDGNKVGEGYKINLCTTDNSNCFGPLSVENGECIFTALTSPGEYVAHVLNASYQEVELKEQVITSADAFGAYTLQLAE